MSSPFSLTWLGHSTFILDLPTGQRVVCDPWLGNPNCPAAWSKPEALGRVDLILVSHGHDDHSADVVPLARATAAPVVCLFELAGYFTDQGVQGVCGMGCGGTLAFGDLLVTMTPAVHSGSLFTRGEVMYLGGAAGFVLRAPAMPTLYFAGDTDVFADMKTIAELYAPEVALLPIGDRFTMGPAGAAVAARWLGVRQVVPMHWGSGPAFTGTPAALKAALIGTTIDVLELAPGETAC